MKISRLVPVTALLTVLLATSVTPALAQGEDTGAFIPEPGADPGLEPPSFVLEEDGTVIIDGDVPTDCRSFASFREQGYFQNGDEEQAQDVLRQCEERGLLTDDAPVLPDTGGPGGTVLFAAGLLLVVGLVGLKSARRP